MTPILLLGFLNWSRGSYFALHGICDGVLSHAESFEAIHLVGKSWEERRHRCSRTVPVTSNIIVHIIYPCHIITKVYVLVCLRI